MDGREDMIKHLEEKLWIDSQTDKSRYEVQVESKKEMEKI